jgi:hypothetical protein
MATKIKDLTGQTFGKLKVLALSQKRSANGAAIWKVSCECGKNLTVLSNSLVQGKTKSCGCAKTPNFSGQNIGNLLVIGMSAKLRQGVNYWDCLCVCGKLLQVLPTNLYNHTKNKSCGCQSYKNLRGKRFGKLLVLADTGRTRRRSRIWKCLCDCGNTIETTNQSLVSIPGSTSCGCTRGGQNNHFYKHGLSKTKGYRKLQAAKRRAAIKNLKMENFTLEDLESHLSKFKSLCVYCGKNYEHLDHVIPISKGGAHTLNNLVPSCAQCNFSKNNKILFKEWNPKKLARNFYEEVLNYG